MMRECFYDKEDHKRCRVLSKDTKKKPMKYTREFLVATFLSWQYYPNTPAGTCHMTEGLHAPLAMNTNQSIMTKSTMRLRRHATQTSAFDK